MLIRIRAVVIGDDGNGKTSLILRYLGKTFKELKPTRIPKIYTGVKDVLGIRVEWIIWEIPSSTHPKLRKAYYEDADGAIIVINATDSIHLYRLYNWISDFVKNCGSPLGKPFVIVANFIDQATTLEAKMALNACREYVSKLRARLPDLVGYSETSAFTGFNVEEPFKILVKLILALRRF